MRYTTKAIVFSLQSFENKKEGSVETPPEATRYVCFKEQQM
jgi:hypothetical protein